MRLAVLFATFLLTITPAHATGQDRDALSRAVAEANGKEVAAALTPGWSWNHAAHVAVLSGLVSACGGNGTPAGKIRLVFSELLRRGYDLNQRDEYGNTLLISAVQSCGADVVGVLLELGAAPGPVNMQSFTPLQMALVSGKWDTAAVLVDHGARLTQEQIDQLFIEKPDKSPQRDLLNRATRR